MGDGTFNFSLNASYLDSDGTNPLEYSKNTTVVGHAAFRNDSFQIGGSFYYTDNKFQSAALVESVQDAPPPYFSVQIPNPQNVDSTKAGIGSLWFEQQLTSSLSQKLTVGFAGQDFTAQEGPEPTANDGLLGNYIAPYDGWTDPNTYSNFNQGDVVPVYQTLLNYKMINNNAQADYNLRYQTDSISAMLGANYQEQIFDVTDDYFGSVTASKSSQHTKLDIRQCLDWLAGQSPAHPVRGAVRRLLGLGWQGHLQRRCHL